MAPGGSPAAKNSPAGDRKACLVVYQKHALFLFAMPVGGHRRRKILVRCYRLVASLLVPVVASDVCSDPVQRPVENLLGEPAEGEQWCQLAHWPYPTAALRAHEPLTDGLWQILPFQCHQLIDRHRDVRDRRRQLPLENMDAWLVHFCMAAELSTSPARPRFTVALSRIATGLLFRTGCTDHVRNWLQGLDLNQRPPGYGPSELTVPFGAAPPCNKIERGSCCHSTQGYSATIFSAYSASVFVLLFNGCFPRSKLLPSALPVEGIRDCWRRFPASSSPITVSARSFG